MPEFRDARQKYKHWHTISIANGQVLNYLAQEKDRCRFTTEEEAELLAMIETGKELVATHTYLLFRKEFRSPTTADV